MQQTETYKLNLIESSDPFLPNALNENTQKIEEVVDGLEQRVQVFEAKKFVYGTCNATAEGCTVQLEFTPIVVLINQVAATNGSTALTVAGQTASGGLTILENGFKFTVGGGYNIRSGPYSYIALG